MNKITITQLGTALALTLPLYANASVLDYEHVPAGYVYGQVIEEGFITLTRRCSSSATIEACVQQQTYEQQFNAGLGNDDSRWINYQQNYLSLNSSSSIKHTAVISHEDPEATFTLSGISLSKAYRYDAALNITIAGYDENLNKIAETTIPVSGALQPFVFSGFDNLKAVSITNLSGNSRFSFDKVNVTATTAEALSCTGFASPMNKNVSVKKNRALPYKAVLSNDADAEITGTDVNTAPVISVKYSSSNSPEDAVEVETLSPGKSSEGNQFAYADGQWQFNLSTSNYSASGNYFVEIASGDNSEYIIEPACVGTFTVK